MTANAIHHPAGGAGTGGACAAVLARLLGNLSGFVYRCRPDARRTMEFVSDACRDVTGYDPHRFIGNQSLTYALLIHPADRARVDRIVFEAAVAGRRFTCGYRLRTAYGAFVEVIDRGVGVLDESGALRAIEGYVERPADAPRPAGAQRPTEPAAVAPEDGLRGEGVMGDDDATAELVDRLPRPQTRDIPAAVTHVQ